jgi:mannose-6-phosphate isomerase
MADLYPLKFKPILKETIWGGNRLKNLMNKKVKAGLSIGESWEISAIQDFISEVDNGFLKGNNLEELIEIYMGDLVGDKIYDLFGIEFPLLIKFIDATDILSIQVHPDDILAKKRHNAYGKTEMWYVIETDQNAELISGFNQKMDKETYINHLENNTLSEILNVEKAQPGDMFFIPAGRVHALGKGILLTEIQQTSDITYRIYDWNRVDKTGKPRELHTHLAVDAIDYTYFDQYKTIYRDQKNQPVNLADCKYFTTNKLICDHTIERDYIDLDSFVIYICVDGELSIKYDEKNVVPLKKGETVLIPASLKNIILEPKPTSTILEVYIK